MVIYSFQPSLI
jgi:hypothetical protein